MKVALYARVSTQEQAQHGLSIDIQAEQLRQWAKDNGHEIAGEYVDAGISGKKPSSKRPALSRFMSDLENGLSVDALIFTKLDRFFRSVKLYYQAMETLDRHGVAWEAIQEDYETVTASGRFKVNIMLSVAEDEADRTSERVKSVMEAKRQRGEYVGGTPFGYTKKDSQLHINSETYPAMQDLFETFIATRSIGEAQRMLLSRYDIKISRPGVRKILLNKNYIELGAIPKETIQQTMEILLSRSQRNTSQSTYIFSGLLYCEKCGKRMMAGSNGHGKKKTYYCASHRIYQTCIKNSISEARVEAILLQMLPDAIRAENVALRESEKPDIEAIKKKMEKLKDLYLEDLISKEVYAEDYRALSSQLSQSSSSRVIDEDGLIAAINVYDTLSEAQRRAFWSNLIRRIYITPGSHVENRVAKLMVL